MPLPQLNVILEGHREMLKRFSATEQKAAIRAAFDAGANWWVANYLPLRFQRYARAKLGYFLQSSHIKRKKQFGAPDPLVWTGETRASVLATARVVVGGSAGSPWADVKMRTGGPRHKIVYEVLNTIIDSEMPGVAKIIGEELQNLLGQGISRGGRSKRLTLSGASSSLSSPRAAAARRFTARNRGDVNDATEDAESDRRRIASERPAAKIRVQNKLKRTHDRWRRTSGGSAPTVGGGMSQTYQSSPRYRHAQAQARHKSRYR